VKKYRYLKEKLLNHRRPKLYGPKSDFVAYNTLEKQ